MLSVIMLKCYFSAFLWQMWSFTHRRGDWDAFLFISLSYQGSKRMLWELGVQTQVWYMWTLDPACSVHSCSCLVFGKWLPALRSSFLSFKNRSVIIIKNLKKHLIPECFITVKCCYWLYYSLLLLFIYLFAILGPHPVHMEVPSLEV